VTRWLSLTFSGKGGEVGGGESTSEGDFRGVGDEEVSAIAFLLIRVLIKVVNKG
jgi:hypothetical protein